MRQVELGILDDSHRIMSDVELDSAVREMHSESPTVGVSMVSIIVSQGNELDVL